MNDGCEFRRRRCAATTRGEILAAARRHFVGKSYENVGLREVAGDVGVDVALIGRYFGSKEGLFRAVLAGDGPENFLQGVTRADLPAYLAALVVNKDRQTDCKHSDKLLISLRSSSSPTASAVVRESMVENLVTPLTDAIGGPDGERKARLVLAVLFGTSIVQTVMAMDPGTGEASARFERQLHRMFAAAIADD